MSMDEHAPVATRSGATLACPKCQADLRIALHEDVEVDACPSCDGVWVDLIEENAVVQLVPKAFTMDDLRLFRKLYHPPELSDEARYVPCPMCQKLMHRKVWGSHSGVIVDKCFAHGTWYDAGELEKVREFVALGGTEFEKMKHTERGLQNLESRLHREVSRLDLRIDSAYRRARLWSLLGF